MEEGRTGRATSESVRKTLVRLAVIDRECFWKSPSSLYDSLETSSVLQATY